MTKKNILFVADKPDWAYEFMIKSWLPYLLDDYDCYIIYQQNYAIFKSNKQSSFRRWIYNNISKIKHFIKKTDLKLIHKDGYFYIKHRTPPLYKYIDYEGNKEKVTEKIFHFNQMIEMAFYFQYISFFPFTADKKIVGIFTDSFPHDGPSYDIKRQLDRNKMNRKQFYDTYLAPYDYIFVGGGNLYNEYKNLTDKVSFVYGIYGEKNFIENQNVGRKKTLTIGWTGTPDRPMKGFREIIEPVIEEIKSTGREVVLKTRFSGAYEGLYNFYEDVDLIVIASSADCGPFLFAEACLSSVPAISTKIGLPSMGIKHNENGLFIERSKESLKEAIIELYENREKLIKFSERIKQDYMKILRNEESVKNVLRILNDSEKNDNKKD
ncbi:MAG: glycosyltransferase [Weeksellaceae bacterium]|nr:glycosyltransferase [Weeksellaceae bacterium]